MWDASRSVCLCVCVSVSRCVFRNSVFPAEKQVSHCTRSLDSRNAPLLARHPICTKPKSRAQVQWGIVLPQARFSTREAAAVCVCVCIVVIQAHALRTDLGCMLGVISARIDHCKVYYLARYVTTQARKPAMSYRTCICLLSPHLGLCAFACAMRFHTGRTRLAAFLTARRASMHMAL